MGKRKTYQTTNQSLNISDIQYFIFQHQTLNIYGKPKHLKTDLGWIKDSIDTEEHIQYGKPGQSNHYLGVSRLLLNSYVIHNYKYLDQWFQTWQNVTHGFPGDFGSWA